MRGTRIYPVTVHDHDDGDSFDVRANLGLGVTKVDGVRLVDIDAPEIETEEGKAAAAHLAELLAQGPLYLTTSLTRDGVDRRDRYGRLLGRVIVAARSGSFDVAQRMLADGHARPYDGGAR